MGRENDPLQTFGALAGSKGKYDVRTEARSGRRKSHWHLEKLGKWAVILIGILHV
jgi:hypothetical protein